MVHSEDFSFLLLILVSYLLVRAGFDRRVFDNIPKLLFNLCFPALILISFSDMGGYGILEPDALVITVFSIVYTLVIFAAAHIAMRHYRIPSRKEIITLNMILGNVTFVGLPFISYFFGAWGVRLAIIFGVVQDFFIWSLCYWMFARKGNLKQTLKTVLNPCFIAVIAGFILSGTQLELPTVTVAPIGMLADITIPLALLCIGSLLAQNTGIFKLVDRDAVISIIIKALVLPAAVFVILTAANINPTLVLLCSLITGLPAALLSVMFAKEFDKDVVFANVVFMLSTLMFILVCIALYIMQVRGIIQF